RAHVDRRTGGRLRARSDPRAFRNPRDVLPVLLRGLCAAAFHRTGRARGVVTVRSRRSNYATDNTAATLGCDLYRTGRPRGGGLGAEQDHFYRDEAVHGRVR